ncbi:MAG: hypothetical protein AB8G05_09155 [Oligoflexales bacterium]
MTINLAVPFLLMSSLFAPTNTIFLGVPNKPAILVNEQEISKKISRKFDRPKIKEYRAAAVFGGATALTACIGSRGDELICTALGATIGMLAVKWDILSFDEKRILAKDIDKLEEKMDSIASSNNEYEREKLVLSLKEEIGILKVKLEDI